ncbi:MAG: ABC1 kinase family protein [Planctomycetota bacterium]|jgi:predicted unusual protein kinase regulating ubiquinone biosynthesis (AarF/ABC1/UbiB family)
MPPTIAELIDALPVEAEQEPSAELQLRELLLDLAHKPVPTGRLTRLWTLGTLQAKIAAAYLAWWIRTSYGGADEKQRQLNETHLRSALRLLGTMGYLRGAVMKVGQILAHYPDVVPEEFADVLGRLHFEAPPMHFALLRELVRNELGRDPEELFDDFEAEAFAAASLGQVHRARIRGSRQALAIKIQYPNMARTIRNDVAILKSIVTPMRLTGDWESLKIQFDDIRRMLDLEIDYQHEARNMRIARDAFAEADDVVVPRVYDDLSTTRVLTMEYLEGLHLDRFLASDPDQVLRDRHGHQIGLAVFRLSYGSHLLYADPHPGNFLFMPDGRLGLIDFGCCHHYTDDDVDYLTEVEQAIHATRDDMRQALMRAADLTEPQKRDEQRLELLEQYCDWIWEPVVKDGPFDFGDPGYFRRGIDLYGEILRRRYVRSLPVNTWLGKSFFGLRAMLSRLKARVDLGAIVRSETTVKRP